MGAAAPGPRSSMCAVGGRESVVYVDLAKAGELGRERGVVRLLARVKACVLQEKNVARLRIPGSVCGTTVAPVGRDELHWPAEHRLQDSGDGLQAHLRHHLAFRAAEVREKNNHPCSLLSQLKQRGQNAFDPSHIRNGASLHRHVQIHPHHNCFFRHIQIIKRSVDGGRAFGRHGSFSSYSRYVVAIGMRISRPAHRSRKFGSKRATVRRSMRGH